MADDAMNKLKKKRASVRTTITKTVKNIETEINKPEVSVDALEELLEHIKIYSEDLNAINTEIENAVDITELDNELKSATEYQDKIITWTFRAGKKIRELSKNNSTEISTTSKVAPEVLTQNFFQKKLTINHFYGDNSQWLTFWNTFETAIHKNEFLDKITKFNYLRTYLKGSALNSIDAEKKTRELRQIIRKGWKISDYEEVFNEWENEDIIEKVESHQEIDEEHYLPHRPVFKENSTTKVRPVFDGSAKEINSPSINDCLEKGPNLIELIPSLINRFRFGKFGVIADIKKAFLQIGLQERDRPFLRFLWREKGKNDNITVYQHNRVVFGISSSPFLLGATIEFHLKNAPDHYKETAHTLLESFYVDNLVCSVNSKEKLDKLIVESQEILEEDKFELRGWEHNNLDPQTENTVPTERRNVPVLGLKWDLDQDLLSVDIKVHESKNEILTKKKNIIAGT
ncbi:integrase_H2C2 domain-containing protein [Trichonephila clavipes]|nr:integrase_H2C2 domain-containing protein [Trichonephila clavipes]